MQFRDVHGNGIPNGTGNPMGNGNKTQNWDWEWEGMGNHLSGNGNSLPWEFIPKGLCCDELI